MLSPVSTDKSAPRPAQAARTAAIVARTAGRETAGSADRGRRVSQPYLQADDREGQLLERVGNADAGGGAGDRERSREDERHQERRAREREPAGDEERRGATADVTAREISRPTLRVAAGDRVRPRRRLMEHLSQERGREHHHEHPQVVHEGDESSVAAELVGHRHDTCRPADRSGLRPRQRPRGPPGDLRRPGLRSRLHRCFPQRLRSVGSPWITGRGGGHEGGKCQCGAPRHPEAMTARIPYDQVCATEDRSWTFALLDVVRSASASEAERDEAFDTLACLEDHRAIGPLTAMVEDDDLPESVRDAASQVLWFFVLRRWHHTRAPPRLVGDRRSGTQVGHVAPRAGPPGPSACGVRVEVDARRRRQAGIRGVTNLCRPRACS